MSSDRIDSVQREQSQRNVEEEDKERSKKESNTSATQKTTKEEGRSSGKSGSHGNLDSVPPSVIALSSLRCPSPPPILNNPRKNTSSPTSSVSTTPLPPHSHRETVPAGGAVLKEKEKEKKGVAFPPLQEERLPEENKGPFPAASGKTNNESGRASPQGENATVSEGTGGYILTPPSQPQHHKSPSVHAHFYVDETIKPGKGFNRSRSGSSHDSESLFASSKGTASKSAGGTEKEAKFTAAPSTEKVTKNAEPQEEKKQESNATIDPRLPQEDGKFHVLFGVCGAVSSSKIKLIISKLIEIYTPEKIAIQLILTEASEHFISQETLNYLHNVKKIRIWRDNDEWSTWKSRLDPVLHIELRRWADILVVCPLTANTLSKIALGLCDNLLTNVIRAWNTSYPILLAPSMVYCAYNSIMTKRQLRLISEEMPWIEFLKPVEKVVGSFGDIGMGGMMDWNEIVNKIVRKLGGYPKLEDQNEDDNEDDNEDVDTENKPEGNDETLLDEDEDDDEDDDDVDDVDDVDVDADDGEGNSNSDEKTKVTKDKANHISSDTHLEIESKGSGGTNQHLLTSDNLRKLNLG